MASARVGRRRVTSLPEPPRDPGPADPKMLTSAELTARLEELFNWLSEVEALPGNRHMATDDENLIDRVREEANLLLEERRERHADEHAPRGG